MSRCSAPRSWRLRQHLVPQRTCALRHSRATIACAGERIGQGAAEDDRRRGAPAGDRRVHLLLLPARGRSDRHDRRGGRRAADRSERASELALDDAGAEAVASTAVIKLNGGLGTSMGMDRAKSLLPVRADLSFLDVIVGQVQHVRRTHDVRLPLLFMNSFRTHDDTLAALVAVRRPRGRRPAARLPAEPRAQAARRRPDARSTGRPTRRSSGARPGTATSTRRWRRPACSRALLDAGFRYATVSNADNLGAAPDPAMMEWFAASGAPYAAEVCRRTPADVKGGHLVVRRDDGRLVLRETAQTPPDDAEAAADLSAAPVLPHQQPLVRPRAVWRRRSPIATASSACRSSATRRRSTPPTRRRRGRADRVGDGRGRRGVRRRDGHRGRPLAVPAGQDHQRPHAAALRRLRGRRGLPPPRPGRAGARRPRPALLRDDRRLRRARARAAVARRAPRR